MKAMRATAPAHDAAPKGVRLRVLHREQPSRNPAAAVGAVLVVLLFVALFGVIAFQAFLVQTQGHLDDANQRVTTEEARAKDLHRAAAELGAPERIIAAAQDRLGMIAPSDVAYLEPKLSDDADAAFDPTRDKAPVTTTVPKATTPATTVPKGKTPATTAPKVTTPATTAPKVTTPATTVPKAKTPATTVPKATTPTTMRGR